MKTCFTLIMVSLTTLRVLGLNNHLSLAWDPNPDSNAMGYHIYVIAPEINYIRRIDAGQSAEWMIDGLSNGVAYIFHATTYDKYGRESPVSNSVQALHLETEEDNPIDFFLSLPNGGNHNNSAYTKMPSKGTLSGSFPNLTYSPFENQTGQDEIGYSYKEFSGMTGGGVVKINITPSSQYLPVILKKSVRTSTGNSVAINLQELQAENTHWSDISFKISKYPSKGHLEGTPPNLTYRSSGLSSGFDSFELITVENSSEHGRVTVSVSIHPGRPRGLSGR